MAYQKQTWNNDPSGETPITAERLNHIEDGIANAVETDSVARVTNVVSRNKAGLKEIAWLQFMDYINITSNGVKYKAKAEEYAGFNLILSKSLEIGKEYTLSFKNSCNYNVQFTLVRTMDAWQDDYNNGYDKSHIIEANTTCSFSFTATTNIVGIMFMCSTNSNADTSERSIVNMQLDEGSVATEYTPYLNLEELQEKSNDTGWLEVPLATDASTLDWCKLSYRKINGIVYVNGIFKLSNPFWSKAFATLPQGFRPKIETDFVCRGVDNIPVVVAITDSGQMAVLQLVTGDFSSEVGGLVSCSFIADN